MSGVYERLVKILAGFVSIRSDTVIHYDQFRRRSLASNLGVLKDKGWGTVCQEFDILIRNSIAHKSYTLRPNERAVHFADPISGREELISYRLLFEKTRDLSCLLLALGTFMGLNYDAILKNMNSFLAPDKNL